MGIYDFPASDLALWQRYAAFHLKWGDGFWSPGAVTRPYGLIQLGVEGEWGDLLWQVHNQHTWQTDDLIRDVEATSAQHLNKPGFYLNATCDPDVASQLQHALSQHGYTKKYDVSWLTLNSLPEHAPDIPAGFTLADTADADMFLRVEHEAFPDQQMDDFYRNNIPVPQSRVSTRFLLLSDPAGEPLAIGGMAWENDTGLLFGLGVRQKERRKGFGKLMVDWRLHELQKQGVKHVVTGVLSDNSESLALQQKKGYRRFAQAEAWLK